MKSVCCHRQFKFVAGALLCLSFAAHAAEPDYAETIKYRRSIMKAQREHMAAASAIIQGKVEFKEQLADHARALEASTKTIAGLFPAGSEAGDTGALSAVWSDSAGFVKRAMDTREKAGLFVKTVNSGEMQNYAARLNDLLDSCKACHKIYRKKEESNAVQK